MEDLTIKIKAVLEGNGISVSNEQLKSLAATARSTETAVKGSGKSAKDGADAIEQFGRKGSEAKDALEGLTSVANGGSGAIFGMAKAWRALTAAFAANPITAALALILGLLPLIKKGFDLIGDAADKSVQKLAGSGKRTAEFQQGLKDIGDAADQNLKKVTTEANAIAAAFAKASGEIDAVLRRFKEVEGARSDAEQAGIELSRQTELAKAKTPEQRAAINAKFDEQSAQAKFGSEKAISNKELSAAAQKADAALNTKTQLEDRLKSADDAVSAARAKEVKLRKAGDFQGAGLALNEGNRLAEDAKGLRAKYGPQIEAAQSTIDDSDASIKANSLRLSAATKTQAAGKISKVLSSGGAFDSEKAASLRQKAEQAQAAGDFVGQGAAVAEYKKMMSAAAKVEKATAEAAAATGKSLEDAAKSQDKLKKRIKATAESTAGS